VAGACHSTGRSAADTHTREMAVVGASDVKFAQECDHRGYPGMWTPSCQRHGFPNIWKIKSRSCLCCPLTCRNESPCSATLCSHHTGATAAAVAAAGAERCQWTAGSGGRRLGGALPLGLHTSGLRSAETGQVWLVSQAMTGLHCRQLARCQERGTSTNHDRPCALQSWHCHGGLERPAAPRPASQSRHRRVTS
jgi:hypothetical protein